MTPATKSLMGIREFAASPAIVARYGRRVAPSTITRMAQDGKLVMVGEGRRAKVDVAASIARMDALGLGMIRTDVSARHATETAHKAAQTGPAIPAPMRAGENGPNNATAAATAPETPATDDDLPGPALGGANKARYKAIALHYENQTIKLGMALSRGARYHKAEVKDEAHGLGNAVRAAVERLIDQTAPRLAVLSNHMDRGHLLRREAAKIKRLFNLEYPQALRRLRKGARKAEK